MIPAYNKNNIFAKILRGEIPSKPIFQNQDAFAFYDIAPKAPIHILVISKGEFVSYEDFCLKATIQQIKGFHDCVTEVLKITNLGQQQGSNGFRVISNTGNDGGQEVPHFHIHILGGCTLGSMISNILK